MLRRLKGPWNINENVPENVCQEGRTDRPSFVPAASICARSVLSFLIFSFSFPTFFLSLSLSLSLSFRLSSFSPVFNWTINWMEVQKWNHFTWFSINTTTLQAMLSSPFFQFCSLYFSSFNTHLVFILHYCYLLSSIAFPLFVCTFPFGTALFVLFK